jgi:hypothetical protein
LWWLKISTKNDVCKKGQDKDVKFQRKAIVFPDPKYSDGASKWEFTIQVRTFIIGIRGEQLE